MTTPEDYLRKRKAEQVLNPSNPLPPRLPLTAEDLSAAAILGRLNALSSQLEELRQLILADLYQTLEATVDESDLRQLCFELGVDCENLAGMARPDRLRELIHQLHKSGRIGQLILAHERLTHGNHPNYRP